MADTRARPPASDELEVSVFGPGKGECIVVHVPGGYWFAVDSLRARTSEPRLQSVPVSYVRGLGAELHAFFVTHWHEDHTAGAAEVLRAFASSLELVGLPSAVNERELLSFVGDRLPEAVRFKPVKDLLAVVTALGEPALKNVRRVVLADGMRLHPPDAEWTLEVLSPSFDEMRASAATLAQFLPEYLGPKPKRHDVNSGCAVLRLAAAGHVVMLCSDLDIGEADDRGWRCIVQHHGARLDSGVVKVGHHGSVTAHHDPAWERYCTNEPTHAVVTPYRPSALPRDHQLKRIRALATTLHVTAANSGKPPKKAGKVRLEHTPFAGYVPTGAVHEQVLGQVRYRWAPDAADCTIEVFKPAFAVA